MKKILGLLSFLMCFNFLFAQNLTPPKFEKDKININGTKLKVVSIQKDLKGNLIFSTEKCVFNDFKETNLSIDEYFIDLKIGGYLSINTASIEKIEFVKSDNDKYIKYILSSYELPKSNIVVRLNYDFLFKKIENILIVYNDEKNKLILLTIKDITDF